MARSELFRDVCPRFFTTRRSLHVIAACTVFLSVVALGAALHLARPVLLPLTTGFIVSVMLAPLAKRLVRLGLPRQAAAALITGLFLSAIVAVLVFSGRPAMSFAERAPELVHEAREKLAGIEKAVTTMREVSEKVGEIAQIGEESQSQEVVAVKAEAGPDAVTRAAPGAIVQFLFVWVMVFFFLAERDDLRRKLVAANRSMRGKMRALRLFRSIEERVGVYMLTMTAINACLGSVLALALWALGMPSPHVWGLLAAVLNFVPFLGPAALTALLLLSGFVHFDGWVAALAPAAIFMALNFIESNFITPVVMGVRMKVTPIAIIVSVSLMTFLWGPVGGVLAIPILLIFKAVCDAQPVLAPVGVLIGDLGRVDRRARHGAAEAVA